ncbi:hypothetical protein BJ546DRAFT_954402 [Cryomyces antarcticus]
MHETSRDPEFRHPCEEAGVGDLTFAEDGEDEKNGQQHRRIEHGKCCRKSNSMHEIPRPQVPGRVSPAGSLGICGVARVEHPICDFFSEAKTRLAADLVPQDSTFTANRALSSPLRMYSLWWEYRLLDTRETSNFARKYDHIKSFESSRMASTLRCTRQFGRGSTQWQCYTSMGEPSRALFRCSSYGSEVSQESFRRPKVNNSSDRKYCRKGDAAHKTPHSQIPARVSPAGSFRIRCLALVELPVYDGGYAAHEVL